MNLITRIATKIVVKLHPRYIGWCYAAYKFYRYVLGYHKYKAWKGAFLLNNLRTTFKR